MDAAIFTLGIRTASAATRFGKKLQDDEAQFLWALVDDRIKTDISNEMWMYGVKRYLDNPESHKDESIHIAIISPFLKWQCGEPALHWGFRCTPQDFLKGLEAHQDDPSLCPVHAASQLQEERLLEARRKEIAALPPAPPPEPEPPRPKAVNAHMPMVQIYKPDPSVPAVSSLSREELEQRKQEQIRKFREAQQ